MVDRPSACSCKRWSGLTSILYFHVGSDLPELHDMLHYINLFVELSSAPRHDPLSPAHFNAETMTALGQRVLDKLAAR